jgi:hypothetical protein
MIQRLLTITFAVVLSATASQAVAQQVRSFHCSGSGFFEPANIGTEKGGTLGLVLGDGSGNSTYIAAGADFTIDGQIVGSGFNAHVGGNHSWTTGIVYNKGTMVRWPANSNQTHVITSDDGEIHMKYHANYTLDLITGRFGGEGNFQIIGGTGRFEKAKGIVLVDVLVTGPPAEPIPFDYDFDGFIVLDE